MNIFASIAWSDEDLDNLVRLRSLPAHVGWSWVDHIITGVLGELDRAIPKESRALKACIAAVFEFKARRCTREHFFDVLWDYACDDQVVINNTIIALNYPVFAWAARPAPAPSCSQQEWKMVNNNVIFLIAWAAATLAAVRESSLADGREQVRQWLLDELGRETS